MLTKLLTLLRFIVFQQTLFRLAVFSCCTLLPSVLYTVISTAVLLLLFTRNENVDEVGLVERTAINSVAVSSLTSMLLDTGAADGHTLVVCTLVEQV